MSVGRKVQTPPVNTYDEEPFSRVVCRWRSPACRWVCTPGEGVVRRRSQSRKKILFRGVCVLPRRG